MTFRVPLSDIQLGMLWNAHLHYYFCKPHHHSFPQVLANPRCYSKSRANGFVEKAFTTFVTLLPRNTNSPLASL